MEIESTLTIDKSRKDVFTFWRNLENLPRFMKHLKDVTVLDDQRSSWSAKLPGGVGKVSWEAVIEQEEENKLLCWTSLPGSTIDNAGEIQFEDVAPGKTQIRAKISYRLPAGDVGSVAGKMFNPVVEKMIKDDLVRFKSLIESGEVSESNRSQPRSSGKRKVGSSVL
ncbi:MAG TPA: SRPBCC family protein [Ohtaekwangia sp.]|nr:SRPBCC family protein [Ohtaekwangia sp.]